MKIAHKGDIGVALRKQENVRQRNTRKGDIMKCYDTCESGYFDLNNRDYMSRDAWRPATEEEITAYNQGIRNIKNITNIINTYEIY